MKRHTGLWLIVTLLSGVAAVACGDSGGKGTPSPDASSSGSSGPTGSDNTSSGAGTSATVTGSSTSTSGGSGGSGTSSSNGSDGVTSSDTSSGPTCDIPSLAVFARSDTEDGWDDNDFSDVVTEGTCPLLVNVTWPHEEGWENADPAEANGEQTHFTLESYYSTDLTGKQLNLTIELVEDVRSPEATVGAYAISLVSVSSYQYDVVQEPPAEAEDAGLGDASADGGTSSADPMTEEVPPTTVTMTGYSEAESAAEDRLVLREVGDRATIRFALPNKTSDIASYDPASVLKINARIYNVFAPPPEAEEPDDVDISEDAGLTDEDAGTTASSSGTSSSNSGSGAPTSAGASSSAVSSTSALESTSSASDSTSSAVTEGPKPKIYGYLTSKFAITAFTVTDAD